MTRLQAMLVSGALLTAPAAMATDLPPEGDYSVTYYNIYHPSKAVPTADNKSASITEETQIFTNDTGQGYFHHVTGRCVFMAVGNLSEAQNSGYCTRVDADGDMVFQSFNGTSSGTESKGSSKTIGGTGKYAGITGSGEYVVTPLKVLDKDSMPISIGHGHGHYRIQSATAQSNSPK